MSTHSQLAKLPKDQLVNAAMSMRKRAMRYKNNADKMGEKLVYGVAGTGAAFGLGMMRGNLEKKFNALLAEKGEAEAKKADPRKIFGLDADLVISGVATGIGLGGFLGKKISPWAEAVGWGGFAGWASSAGEEMALKKDEAAA